MAYFFLSARHPHFPCSHKEREPRDAFPSAAHRLTVWQPFCKGLLETSSVFLSQQHTAPRGPGASHWLGLERDLSAATQGRAGAERGGTCFPARPHLGASSRGEVPPPAADLRFLLLRFKWEELSITCCAYKPIDA